MGPPARFVVLYKRLVTVQEATIFGLNLTTSVQSNSIFRCRRGKAPKAGLAVLISYDHLLKQKNIPHLQSGRQTRANEPGCQYSPCPGPQVEYDDERNVRDPQPLPQEGYNALLCGRRICRQPARHGPLGPFPRMHCCIHHDMLHGGSSWYATEALSCMST